MGTEARPADLLVFGATGRLGGFLRAVWHEGGQAGPRRVLWQTRAAAPGPGWVHWTPDAAPPVPAGHAEGCAATARAQTLPPARNALVLSGVTAGTAEVLAANTPIVLAACRAARAAGARRILVASSAAVYGAPGDDPDETTAPAPLRPYGAAKLAMERAVTAWQAATPGAPGVCLLRIGNVVGADLLGDAVASGRPITLDRFGPADQAGPLRSYIAPQTLAAVLETLVAAPALPDIVNVAAPGAIAMADLLRTAAIPFDWRPAPADALVRAVMVTARLERLFTFPPGALTAAGMVADWQHLTGQPIPVPAQPTASGTQP